MASERKPVLISSRSCTAAGLVNRNTESKWGPGVCPEATAMKTVADHRMMLARIVTPHNTKTLRAEQTCRLVGHHLSTGHFAYERPSHFSISSSLLYFARRSDRVIEPTLICPAPEATDKSARKESSVSPDRAE